MYNFFIEKKIDISSVYIMSNKRVVTLLPTQIGNSKRLLYKIKYMRIAINKSETGSGKTYESIYILEELVAARLCNKVICIVPDGVTNSWVSFVDKVGISYGVYSHTQISSATDFTEKTMVIIDEVHLLSGVNNKTAALDNVVKQIRDNKSRLLLLSATPFSDYNHAYSLFANMGLINSEATTKPKITTLKKFDYGGFIKDIEAKIALIKKSITPEEYTQLEFDKDFDLTNIPAYDGRIIDRISALHCVIMNVYASECPRFLPPNLIIKSENTTYNLHENDIDAVSDLITEFKTSTGFTMLNVLRRLHTYELPYMLDVAMKRLRQHNRKIILCVIDNMHVNLLNTYLGEQGFACVTLYAGMDQLGRQSAQQLFNMYNTVYRVIIVTVSVANSGISLHDTAPRDKYPDGFPRTLITFVDPDPLRRTQMLGRHIRTGITSDSVETLVVSTNIKSENKFERNIIYNKTCADVDLITMSMKSTDDASKFTAVRYKLNDALDTYRKYNALLDKMREYL